MSVDSRSVANLLLEIAKAAGVSISNLEIQKHLYFCQVWSLVEFKRKLISDEFEAWRYGPVIPQIYRQFSVFGSGPIQELATRLNPKTGEREIVPAHEGCDDVRLVERAFRFYSKLSPSSLVALAHEEGGPWHRAWFHSNESNPGMKISNDDITDFYSSRAKLRLN